MTRQPLLSSLRYALEALFVALVAFLIVLTLEAVVNRCSRHVDHNATQAEKGAAWTQFGGQK